MDGYTPPSDSGYLYAYSSAGILGAASYDSYQLTTNNLSSQSFGSGNFSMSGYVYPDWVSSMSGYTADTVVITSYLSASANISVPTLPTTGNAEDFATGDAYETFGITACTD